MMYRTLSASLLLLLAGCLGAPSEVSSEDLDAVSVDTASALGDNVDREPIWIPGGLGPARVRLGSPTDPAMPAYYTLLASAAITNVTGSSIRRGHVGLSPSAASYITGFGLVMDPSNTFATSAAVPGTGKLYAADFAPPTPSNLTTAVNRTGVAYRDAAGRSNPDYLNLNGGDLGGLTLAPGLYTWGSSVTIPTNVTIAGAANDRWIFQIANDLDVSAGMQVILSGGAQARNIVWQVAGQVTVHESADFQGIILCATGVTLQTNARLHGQVYARTLIALDDNLVVGL